jgi:hypothetical protein
MQTVKGGRSVTIPILNLGAGKAWAMNAIPQPLYPWERALVPTVEDGGNRGQSGRVTKRENIFPWEQEVSSR